MRAPEATDADGAPVPVRYDIRGKRLSLEVDHRQGDYRYPILVDPVVEDQNRWNTNSSIDFRGWRYYRNGLFNAQSGRYGRGLYINRDPTYMQNGQYGEWYYQAPGDAFVYRAEFLDGHHDDQGSSCVTEYVSGGDGAQMCGGGHNLNRTFCTRDNCAVDGPRGNHMAFRFGFSGDMQVTRNVGGFLGGARVYMHDTFAPSLDAPVAQVDPGTSAGVPEPTGWTRQRSFATRFTGRDGGLGVKRHRVENPSGAIVAEKVYAGCTAQCPQVLTQTVPYTLPDGLHSLRARVRDNPDHPSALSAPWERRVDATAPTVTSTGTLKDSQADWLRDGTKRSLRIDARDEDPSGPRAGVGSLKVEVDGKTVEPTSTCAQDSCRLVRDFSFDPAVYGDGRHTVKATVRDRAGNEWTETYAVKVDGRGPTLSLSGLLSQAEDMPLTEPSYDLRVEAIDPGAGVRSVEILVDGQRKDFIEQTDPADGAALARNWSFEPKAYKLGVHTIEIRSVDRFDQAVSKTFKVESAAQTGEIPRYEFDRHELTDKLDLSVNVANGNLVMRGVDYEAQMTETTDLEYPLERYFNSLGTENSTSALAKGGWSLGTGTDGRLAKGATGSVAYTDPSGLRLAFLRQSDGSFRSPPGLDEQVASADGGGLTMTATETGEQKLFDGGGLLTARTDPDGGRIDYAYNDQRQLTSVADSDGRSLRYEYDAEGFVSKMVDPDSREHRYEHERLPVGAGRLTGYVGPGGERTEFRYDPLSGRLVGVKDSAGHRTNIGYDGEGRVKELVKDPDVATGLVGGEKTTYSYEVGRTQSTDPSGRATTYLHDPSGVVTQSSSGDSPPALELSGSLKDESKGVLSVDGDYELTTQASSDSGLKEIDLSIDNTSETPSQQPCSSGCGSLSNTFRFLTEDLPEGESFVRVLATDASGNTRTQSMRVTAPPPPAPEPFDEPLIDEPAATATQVDGSTSGAEAFVPVSAAQSADTLAIADTGAVQPFKNLVLGISGQAIGNESTEFFKDPAIDQDAPDHDPSLGLKVRRVRFGVPWNVAELPYYLRQFEEFRSEIRRQGGQLGQQIDINLVFNSGCHQVAGDSEGTELEGTNRAAYNCLEKDNPSFRPPHRDYITKTGLGTFTARFNGTVRSGFRKRYSDVKTFTPFNEPNQNPQFPFRGLRNADAAAAQFFDFDRVNCPARDCTLVAGDLAQASNVGRGGWTEYLARYRAGLAKRYGSSTRNPRNLPFPRVWGFHPYRDLQILRYKSRRSSKETERPQYGMRKFIAATGRDPLTNRRTSEMWISEIGSRVDPNPNNPTPNKPLSGSGRTQEDEVRYLLNTLARTGGRPRRLYYHTLCFGDANFDSALLGDAGNLRRPGCQPTQPTAARFQEEANYANRAR